MILGNHLNILIILIFFTFIESKYEIILDRMEAYLGETDEIFKAHSCRVKKFNRTT
jgi:hypothetical protein